MIRLREKRIKTIEEAHRALAKKLDDGLYERYRKGIFVKQQGAYLLIPQPHMNTRQMKKQAQWQPKYIIGITEKDIVAVPRNSEKDLPERSYAEKKMQQGVWTFFVKTFHPKDIPKDAIVYKGRLATMHKMLKQTPVCRNGEAIARDKIVLKNNTYVRGTLRRNRYDMVRMGETWHKIVELDAERIKEVW